MSISVISKEQNSSEIILKNAKNLRVVSKRSTLTPTKYLKNYKKVNTQLDKKKEDLVKGINVAFQNSKIQDERNHQDILKLYNKSLQVASNYKNLKKYLLDLNTEIKWWQNKVYKNEKKFQKAEFKKIKKQNINPNLNEILYEKTIMYNKEAKKENAIKTDLDDILNAIIQKKNLYNLLKIKLKAKKEILYDCSEISSECYQDREKALNVLTKFRKFNDMTEMQREKIIYMTKYKLKVDLERYEFLRKKCSSRRNRSVKNVFGEPCTDKESLDQTEKKKKHELNEFIKYLTHISADKDLKSIMINLDKINFNKNSLVNLLLYFEEHLANLETATDETRSVAIDQVSANRIKDELQDQQLKTYLETIYTNKRNIESTRKLIVSLKDIHAEFCERIYGIFLKLKIDTSCNERLFMKNRPTEENILCYITEMEKRSMEMLFLVNLMENHVDTQNPATSDADSVPDLIAKDYHGVEIRPHRLFNIEDPSSLPLTNSDLTTSNMPTMCPGCVEFHFESVLSNLMTRKTKQNSQTKPLDIFNSDVINQFDFKNIHSKLSFLIHSQHGCKNNE